MSNGDTSDDDGVSTVDQYEARLAECEDALRAAREQLASLDAGGDLPGVGTLSDDPLTDGMVGTDLDGGLESDFDCSPDGTWTTVPEATTEAPGYPVLQALDRETQLEARS